MHIHTLHKQGFEAKAITASSYPDKKPELKHVANNLPLGRWDGFSCDAPCR